MKKWKILLYFSDIHVFFFFIKIQLVHQMSTKLNLKKIYQKYYVAKFSNFSLNLNLCGSKYSLIFIILSNLNPVSLQRRQLTKPPSGRHTADAPPPPRVPRADPCRREGADRATMAEEIIT